MGWFGHAVEILDQKRRHKKSEQIALPNRSPASLPARKYPVPVGHGFGHGSVTVLVPITGQSRDQSVARDQAIRH